MKATLEGNELVIRIAANVKSPSTSASGKSRVVASTRGNVNTGLQVNGKDLIVGLNAYIEA